jgi:Rps23 Pro-64 3,4-dihydroxylase Tpa1-like proline 4-hydroxylase
MNRTQIADLIYKHLVSSQTHIQQQFNTNKDAIPYFYLDDVLPEELALQLFEVFPSSQEMMLKKSLKEDKFVGFQMNQYNSWLEECIYAFQQPKIVDFIAEICGIEHAIPDENLYAGGLSSMGENQFLNPHLDNSHDKDRQLWRVLNLLFYVTPCWKLNYGGNLELWPEGLKKDPITIHSKFNRLVVMATHQDSLHSVSSVKKEGFRCCISNYYFSKKPFRATDEFHVTSFRGRPNELVKDKILQLDNSLRMGIRKVFKKGIVENPHVYKKK